MFRELALRDVPPANDNVRGGDVPTVRRCARRSKAAYACSENVILPLLFARRMPGWSKPRA